MRTRAVESQCYVLAAAQVRVFRFVVGKVSVFFLRVKVMAYVCPKTMHVWTCMV